MAKESIEEKKLRIIYNCAKCLMDSNGFADAAKRLLREVMEFYKAGRIYIFEFLWDKDIAVNIEEVCAESVEPQKDNLQSVPLEAMDAWLAYFRDRRSMHVSDVGGLQDGRDLEREILSAQGIKELLAVPLYYENELYGMLGVDDPTDNNTDDEFLFTMGSVLCGEMLRNKAVHQKEEALAEVSEVSNSAVCGMAKFMLAGDMPLFYANETYYTMRECFTAEERADCRKNTLKFVFEDDLPYVLKAREESVKNRPANLTLEYRILTIKRNVRWIRRIITFLHSENAASLCICTDIDITEQKANEDKVALEKKKLSVALRLIRGFYMWEYDIKNDIMYAGENFVADSINKRPVVENAVETTLNAGVIYPEDKPQVIKMHEAIFDGAPFAECEFRVIGTDPVRWRRIRYTTSYDEKGQPYWAIGSAQDVTEERRAIDLYNEQLKYRDIIDKGSLGSFRLNLTAGTIGDVRTEYEEYRSLVSGNSLDAFFQKLYARIDDEARLAVYKRTFNRSVLIDGYEQGKTRFSFEHHFAFSADDERWIRTTVDLFKNPFTGDIEGIVYAIDINEEKLISGVLNTVAAQTYDFIIAYENKTKRMRVLNNRPDVALNFDVRSVDELWAECLARLADEADKQRMEKELTVESVAKRLAEMPVYNLDFTVKGCDGELRHTRHTFTYLDEVKGTVCYTSTDITDIYVKEELRRESLQDALDTAERANLAKSEFLSKMSHEIRTPLNAIVGYTTLSKKSVSSIISSPDSPTEMGNVYGNLVKTETASKHLLSIINEVLDMSAIESGNKKLNLAEFSLNALLDSLGEMYVPQAAAKGIAFEIKAGEIEECVVGDKLHLNQILINLLSNAVKFTPAGGAVTLTVTQLTLRQRTAYFSFEVKDTGIGMTADFMRRMYAPFEQQDPLIAQRYGGTGLGLSITKNLVGLMKGSISAVSEPGRGTTFTVEIPMQLADSCDRREAEPKSIGSHSVELAGRRVLLAEDNSMNREIAEAILSGAGIVVECAKNGEQAVFMFTNMPKGYYDFILMDIIMPEMDGYEATKRIRASAHPDAKSIPIIAMSANAFTEDVTKSLESGMNNHIAKPIDVDTMFKTITQSLRQK